MAQEARRVKHPIVCGTDVTVHATPPGGRQAREAAGVVAALRRPVLVVNPGNE